jgi:hypothetical protein
MRTGIATPRPLPLPDMPGLWLLLLQPRGRVRGLSRKREGFVKTGTVALPDPVNGRLIQAQSLGGFLEANPINSTASIWWLIGPQRRTLTTSSEYSTIWQTSPPSCKWMPRSKERIRKAKTSEHHAPLYGLAGSGLTTLLQG